MTRPTTWYRTWCEAGRPSYTLLFFLRVRIVEKPVPLLTPTLIGLIAACAIGALLVDNFNALVHAASITLVLFLLVPLLGWPLSALRRLHQIDGQYGRGSAGRVVQWVETHPGEPFEINSALKRPQA